MEGSLVSIYLVILFWFLNHENVLTIHNKLKGCLKLIKTEDTERARVDSPWMKKKKKPGDKIQTTQSWKVRKRSRKLNVNKVGVEGQGGEDGQLIQMLPKDVHNEA